VSLCVLFLVRNLDRLSVSEKLFSPNKNKTFSLY